MRTRVLSLLLVAAAVAASLLPFSTARAGVPRACLREHPAYDREACAIASREQLREVVPLFRLRTLDADRERRARRVPLQDAERNELLREIRDALRAEETAEH